MLTLITGTPGAGKTLLATWEFARPVPGSTIEQSGQAVPRALFSNIRDLLVDHQHITGKDLESWQTWAKPGDVIIFDEVQEVWRPRGLGVKVPPEIAALETHRHMGVDLVLITQHPMLIDPNIRRLVNQHLHLRRITRGVAMVYEWDHCENPGQTKTCIAHRTFFHRKKMYGLYKSAQLHTKPTVRMPKAVWMAGVALAGLAYIGPAAWSRVTGQYAAKPEVAKTVQAAPVPGSAMAALPAASAPVVAAVPASFAASASKPAYLGCAMRGKVCRCYDEHGERVEVEVPVCLAKIPQAPAADLSHLVSVAELPMVHPASAGADIEVLAFMRDRRASLR